MKNLVRMAALAAAVTAVATPASAQVSANPPARARVNVVKPLALEQVSDLHFGNVIVWDSGTVQLATDGSITCPSQLDCDDNGTAAQYRVRGTNGYTVTVTATDSTLTNGTTNILFSPDAPATVPLTNSGQAGVVFNVGGSVAIPANATGGLYVGDMDVTVEY